MGDFSSEFLQTDQPGVLLTCTDVISSSDPWRARMFFLRTLSKDGVVLALFHTDSVCDGLTLLDQLETSPDSSVVMSD